MAAIDPATLTVIQRRLKAITNEMSLSLLRSARSTILSEAKDFVTALFDAGGRLLEQTEHIPVLAYALPPAMEQVIRFFGDEIYAGDIILHNDPFTGGNQCADVKVIKPVFYENRLAAWVAISSHQADIGGGQPGGYNPTARTIFEEALRIPPVKLFEAGRLRRDVWGLVFGNVRFDDLVEGDIKAAIGGATVGARAYIELLDAYGHDVLQYYTQELIASTERMMRSEIARIPNGVYRSEAIAFHDGFDPAAKMPVCLCLTVAGDELTFDYTGTAPQTQGYVNSPLSATLSSTMLSLLMCIDIRAIPNNVGRLSPIHIIAPEGSMLNPRFPAATSYGNHLADQISAAVFRALAQAVPDRVTAGWNPTHNAVVVGRDPRRDKAFVDLLFIGAKGGGGALRGHDGYDHIGSVYTAGGARAQDPEMFEHVNPLLIHRYEYATDSPGAGRWRGGYGVRFEMECLAPVDYISVIGDGTVEAARPFGLFGGQPGCLNVIELIYPDGRRRRVASKEVIRDVPAGTRWHQTKAGGGGYGDARERSRDQVRREVRQGLISPDSAVRDYGLDVSFLAEEDTR
jgi:N-methylhydantoinase B